MPRAVSSSSKTIAPSRKPSGVFLIEGYTVETQADGRSALESFQSSAPAAVILDLRLPEVSGLDVCKEIKALAPTLPIVVLSAASGVSDKVLLLESGADDL